VPETIIGENVVVKGELKFERLLHINGLCTGELISTVRDTRIYMHTVCNFFFHRAVICE
jgi:cytoskeletal protein CcmA (bactofilin family)